MGKRGFTLIEIVVYFSLSTLILLVVFSLFIVANRAQQKTYSSYLVSGRTHSALTVIRRDLQGTALSALTAYPNQSDSSESPGMSFPSAYGHEKKNRGELHLSAYGSPEWQKIVHYTIEKKGDKVGSLVRWSQKIADPDFRPVLGTLLPSNIQGTERHILIEDVLLAGQKVDGVGQGGSFQATEFGGFEVKFVRRQGGEDGVESLSAENPSSQDPSGNTRLVQVTLRILRDEKSGRPTLYVLKIRACPRY